MTELRVVWRVAMGALRESFSSIRPYFVALLALVLMRMASSDICQLCAQYGEKASVLPLFIYAFNATYYILTLNFLFLVLACDVPLRKNHQRFIVLRCGRTAWAKGQILYLFLLAALYLAWVFFASIIAILPHVSFSLDWGRVYYSLARVELNGSLPFSQTIQEAFSAAEAFMICLSLQWLCMVFFGLMIYGINLATGKNIGMILPLVFLLLYFRLTNFIVGISWTLWISPVYLSRVQRCVGSLRHSAMGLPYAFCFFIVAIVVLGTCCVELARRQRSGIDMRN